MIGTSSPQQSLSAFGPIFIMFYQSHPPLSQNCHTMTHFLLLASQKTVMSLWAGPLRHGMQQHLQLLQRLTQNRLECSISSNGLSAPWVFSSSVSVVNPTNALVIDPSGVVLLGMTVQQLDLNILLTLLAYLMPFCFAMISERLLAAVLKTPLLWFKDLCWL